jgi:prolyl 4-hydroxylase
MTKTNAKYRISKSSWLQDRDHKVVQTLSNRVEDMTGMTSRTAEELQVVNYGIGGQYEPHLDHYPTEAAVKQQWNVGNRISTMLFYVSSFFLLKTNIL